MKTEQVGKINISTSARPRAKFNLSHDVNTTFSWGDTQPLLCRLMAPNTKNTLQIDSLVRLAPMVSPTFGRIKYKNWHQFVPISDVWRTFPNFISQSSTFGVDSSSFIPPCVPQIPICLLTAMCLVGAKVNVFQKDPQSAYYYWSDYTDRNSIVSSGDLSAEFLNSSIVNLSNTSLPSFNYNGPTLSIGSLFSAGGITAGLNSSYGINNLATLSIPIANKTRASFSRITSDPYPDYSTDFVSLDSADLVIPVTVYSNNVPYTYLLAFRLSSFGKRLRKILLGLGYQLDLHNLDLVSVLPILAYYKAYWDLFGLTKFKAWNETVGYRLNNLLSVNNAVGVSFTEYVFKLVGTYPIYWSSWSELVAELGNSFATELPDYVGSHVLSVNTSPSTSALDFIDTTSFANSSDKLYRTSDEGVNYLAGTTYPVAGRRYGTTGYIPSVNGSTGNGLVGFLSGLSVKSLMRLYRWTNKNTIAGSAIEDLLKAQGYGYYVYSCKSNFIGYEEHYIPISDVVSSSDTYNSSSSEGALLGQYGGRGLGYNESKSFEFTADEFGYWVTIACIVPESGYCQGIDYSVYARDKFDFYNPEFDGLGYEATPLGCIVGDAPFHTDNTSIVKSYNFGFIPRYSGYKVAPNVNNGDFSLRSSSKTYQTFELDKEIPLALPFVGKEQSIGGSFGVEVIPALTKASFPTAGEIWRYIARYPWLGSFDRIFAITNDQNTQDRLIQLQNVADDSLEYVVNNVDNFNVHNVLNFISYAPMLPIESSFGTESDTGSFDSAIDKT